MNIGMGMESEISEDLSLNQSQERRAVAIACDWLDSVFRQGRYSQLYRIMNQIGLAAAKEAVIADWTEKDLCLNLQKAHNVLKSLRSATLGDMPNRDEETIWKKHDLRQVFVIGLRHRDYFSMTHNSVTSKASIYLSHKWMRNPEIDWIIVDALVSGETILFGERLKETALSSMPSDIFKASEKYQKHQGNLAKLRKRSFSNWIAHIVESRWSYLFLPIGAFYAFENQWNGIGNGILVFVSVSIFFEAIQLFRRVRNKSRGTVFGTEEERWMGLWKEMIAVSDCIEPPVVNPLKLKLAIEKATVSGVVFKEVVHAIVSDHVAINPNMWLIQDDNIPVLQHD
jgi:hypothetical protein